MKQTIKMEDLEVLAKLCQSKTWEVLSRLLDNRREKDKNSILNFPEYDPVKLATNKAFYRGRISAIDLLMKEVNDAGKNLDKLSEKE